MIDCKKEVRIIIVEVHLYRTCKKTYRNVWKKKTENGKSE